MTSLNSDTNSTKSIKKSRRKHGVVRAGAIAAISACTLLHASEPIDIPGFRAIPRPAPTVELSYGAALSQGIDIFVPGGAGPHPVVVLIHGGCWSEKTAAREQVRHLGADLAAHGIAAWSIGYRRADELGGGYPNTFLDVGSAIDLLRENAARYNFDLSRVVLVGHSAGGHLALWAASRAQLPRSSPLRVPNPFIPRKVVSIAGIGDLKAYAPQITPICGPAVSENLVGSPSDRRSDVFSDTSPAALAPGEADIVMVSGTLDRLVPPYVAHDYARQAQQRSQVKRIEIAESGHFDLVATTRPAWGEIRKIIQSSIDE